MPAMPTEAQIEAAAREMFYMSWGAALGLYHWPGDEPRPVKPRLLGAEDDETIPADDASAPGDGHGPRKLREIARAALLAAEQAE